MLLKATRPVLNGLPELPCDLNTDKWNEQVAQLHKNWRKEFVITRGDAIFMCVCGCVGMVFMYIVTQSWIMTFLIGLNCGVGGGAAALAVLRLLYGHDVLQLDKAKNMAPAERVRACVNITIGVLFFVVINESLFPEQSWYFYLIPGSIILFAIGVLCHGWICHRQIHK